MAARMEAPSVRGGNTRCSCAGLGDQTNLSLAATRALGGIARQCARFRMGLPSGVHRTQHSPRRSQALWPHSPDQKMRTPEPGTEATPSCGLPLCWASEDAEYRRAQHHDTRRQAGSSSRVVCGTSDCLIALMTDRLSGHRSVSGRADERPDSWWYFALIDEDEPLASLPKLPAASRCGMSCHRDRIQQIFRLQVHRVESVRV